MPHADRTLSASELPFGLPVIDGSKLPAHPPQDQALASLASFIQRHASGPYAGIESFLHARYVTYNHLYFEARLPPAMHVKVGRCTSMKAALGQYRPVGDHGFRGEIILADNVASGKSPYVTWNGDWCLSIDRLFSDILLHQMVHAYCDQTEGVDATKHGAHFRVVAGELNVQIGIRRNAKHAFGVARDGREPPGTWWPMCVRPAAYYEGVWVADPCRKKPRTLTKQPDNGYEVLKATVQLMARFAAQIVTTKEQTYNHLYLDAQGRSLFDQTRGHNGPQSQS